MPKNTQFNVSPELRNICSPKKDGEGVVKSCLKLFRNSSVLEGFFFIPPFRHHEHDLTRCNLSGCLMLIPKLVTGSVLPISSDCFPDSFPILGHFSSSLMLVSIISCHCLHHLSCHAYYLSPSRHHCGFSWQPQKRSYRSPPGWGAWQFANQLVAGWTPTPLPTPPIDWEHSPLFLHTCTLPPNTHCVAIHSPSVTIWGSAWANFKGENPNQLINCKQILSI